MVDIYNASHAQDYYYKGYTNSQGENVLWLDLDFSFSGEIDLVIFKKTWEHIIRKYPIFRTAFFLTNENNLIQVVGNLFELNVQLLDWRNLSDTELSIKIREIKRDDYLNKVSLEKPPIFKLAVILKDNEKFSVWWRFPVLLMDGWNIPIIYNDFISTYNSLEKGHYPSLIVRESMKEYISITKRRDKTEEILFWKEYINKEKISYYIQPSLYPITRNFKRMDLDLSDIESQMRITAKSLGVSLSTYCQTCYMLILSALKNEKYIICRTTVADRPSTIHNMSNRVGLYTNELLMRSDFMDDNCLFSDFIKKAQEEQNKALTFSSSSIYDIQEYLGVKGNIVVDDTITFENMPVTDVQYSDMSFNIESYNFEHHPDGKLNLFIWAGSPMKLKMIYDSCSYEENQIAHILNNFKSMLSLLNENRKITIKQLQRTYEIN